MVVGNGFSSTGSKYLEYLSRIRTLNNNWTIIEQYCLRIEDWLKQAFELNVWLNKKEKNHIESECKCTTNAQYTIYANHPKKTLEGSFCSKPRGTCGDLSGSNPLTSDGSRDSQTWEPVCHKTEWQRHCTEELFLSTHYIQLSLHIRKVIHEGEKDADGQHDTFSGPGWIASLQITRFPIRMGFSVQ
jgi:hypothetical protein